MESSKRRMNARRKAVDIAIARRCPTDAAKYARLLGREVLNRKDAHGRKYPRSSMEGKVIEGD